MGASKGSLGAALGAAAGLALAPATGGASLALYGAGGALLGGSIGSGMDAADAAEDAAKLQRQSADAAIAEQQAARQQIAQQLAPYMGAGVAAQSQLLSLLGITTPEQASAYESALTYKPRFSDKERAMIIQAGPSQRGRTSEQMEKLAGGMGSIGTRAGGGATTERVSPELFRYQQALAEQDRITRNQQIIQQYQKTTQSPEFGMLTRDVTQGLPSILPADIEKDTLFQSLKRQAISGIEGSAAARGKLMSGTTPQAIAEQVQNLALGRAGQIQAQNLAARQQLFGERTGEQQRRYQQLFGLVGTGQASAAQQAANIQGSAANIGEYMTQAANAQAAGQIGAANAQAQMFQGLLGAGTTLATANMLRSPVATPTPAPGLPAAPLPGLGGPGYTPGLPAAPLPGLGGPGYMNIGGTGITAPWRV